jgi:hypothetical protein
LSSSYRGEPVNKNNNNIITPALPTASPGYPINLFFAISDIPPNPAPIISSIVISSYVVIIFEASEILSKDFSYALVSTSALYCRFANELQLIYQHAEYQYMTCIYADNNWLDCG